MHRLSAAFALLFPIACSTTAPGGGKADGGVAVERDTEKFTAQTRTYAMATKEEAQEFDRIWELYRARDPRWPRERDRFRQRSEGAGNLMATVFLKYYMELNAMRSERGRELTLVKNEIVAVGEPCAPFLVDLMVLDRIPLEDGRFFLTDDITRQDCMDMLERMGGGAVPALLQVLERRDLGVKGRRLAASALGGTRDPRAFEPVARLLREDESWQVRADAATGLGKLGDRRAIQPLNQAIMGDRDEAVRARAQKAKRRILAGSAR